MTSDLNMRMSKVTITNRPTLEPSEFCKTHFNYNPDIWGDRGRCNRLLAQVLDISVKTVEGWGDNFKECPERYKRELDIINSLMMAEDTLKRYKMDRDSLS